jgi:hypothetical protein
VSSFANSGAFHARVTAMQWMNAGDEPLLITGGNEKNTRLLFGLDFF